MKKEKDNRLPPLTIEEVSRIAKETLLKHGNHVPMLLVEGNLNSSVRQATPMPEDFEAKQLWMIALGYEMGSRGNLGELQQVFFISEGWMSMGKDEQAFAGPPSKDPNRKEVLIIFARIIPALQPKAVAWEMIRDEAGKLTELRDFSAPEVAHPASPLVDAFVAGFQRGTKHAKRKLN